MKFLLPILFAALSFGQDTQLTTLGTSTNFGEQLSRIGPYNISGVLYVMVAHQVQATGQGIITVNYSSNDGATWSTVADFNTASIPGATGFLVSVCAPETYMSNIYCLVQYRVGGTPSDQREGVFYFQTSDLTWHALASQPTLTAPEDDTMTPLTPGPSQDITVNSSTGDITIAYSWGVENFPCGSGHKDRAFRRVQYSDYTSGTWGLQSDIPGQSGIASTIYFSQILRSPGGRMHFFFYDFSIVADPNTECSEPLQNSTLYHISRSSDGTTWNTFQVLTSLTGTVAPFQLSPNNGFPFGQGIITGGNIIVPYMTGTSNVGPGIAGMSMNTFVAADADVPTWSAVVVDSTIDGGNTYNVPGSSAQQETTSSITDSGGSITIYYVVTTATGVVNHKAANGVIRASTFSGSTWGAFSTYRDFTVGSYVPTGVYAFTPTRALYFKVVGGQNSATQTNMFHFLGAPVATHKIRHRASPN